MSHLYLFTLEIVPLEVGRIYDELPSHLTLMSRFVSTKSAEEIAAEVRPLFAETHPIELVFEDTTELGPKKATAHMIHSPGEQMLHKDLRKFLTAKGVVFQYPQFIGGKHRPHVTQRQNVNFAAGSNLMASTAYLIEVVNGKRVIRSKFTLND